MASHQDGPRLGRTSFSRSDWAWQDGAACRGEDLRLFFGGACPVREQCLDHAIDRPEKFGVWGGQNEDDRHRERRNRGERERRKKDAA